MAATILDVAKLCGYSKATVSRAFANPECVSEKARNKIYKAAKALNYTPNAIARAMVRGRTDNIGFIIYEKQYPVVINPFYAPIFESILQECTKNGYSLFISSDRDIRLPSGEVYTKKHMDGVIIAGQSNPTTIFGFRKQNIPIVLLNNLIDMDDLLCITADNYGGSVKAMRYLIEKGHRKIGLIAGQFSPHIYSSRYNGYVDVLRESGLEIDFRFIQDVEPTLEAAEQCVTAMLYSTERPTALFCTNDTIAIGAVKAVLRAGLRIPEDMSIIGFDDSEISHIIEPELTTVRVQTRMMGEIAAQKLIAMIHGEIVNEHMIETPTELIRRKTTV